MNRSPVLKLTYLLLALATSLPEAAALTEAEATAGREIAQRTADAIVGVEMVVTLKMTMGDRAAPPRENKVDVNGTVLNAQGLTVTSLAAIDPRIQFEAMRALMGGAGQRMELSDTDYKEVKLRLADGSEVPARVVLKDADLDLAFIAPEAGAGTVPVFKPIKLAEAGEAKVLDTCFVVTRATKALRRVPLVRAAQVMGQVDKPRRLILLTDQQMGSPVFNMKGGLVGISLQNLAAGRPAGLVCVPAADIAEIAKQAEAEAAKPPAPKAEASAPKVDTPEPAAAPETQKK